MRSLALRLISNGGLRERDTNEVLVPTRYRPTTCLLCGSGLPRLPPRGHSSGPSIRQRRAMIALLVTSCTGTPGMCSPACVRGFCYDGRCVCDRGFGGPACNLAVDDFCPMSCSGHGSCTANGTCICMPPFTGGACDRTSSLHCPNACSSRGRCKHDGRCACDQGFEAAADCSVASSDACPSSCSAHGVCVGHTCVCAAGFGGVGCERLILASACPSGCSGRGTCAFDGTCHCLDGYGGEACELVLETPNCPSNCSGHGVCENGGPGGAAHCRCRSQLQYSWGGPGCESIALPTGCPLGCSGRGTCLIDPSSPAVGRCLCKEGFGGVGCEVIKPCPHNCRGRGVCIEGQCECVRGWKGPSCDDPKCAHDCSGHGECLSSLEPGADGACLCAGGWAGFACDEWQPHCPNSCSGHGECLAGRCACEPGFVGEGCERRPGAPPKSSVASTLGDQSCGAKLCSRHGRCVRGRAEGTVLCACFDGFGGRDCSIVADRRRHG